MAEIFRFMSDQEHAKFLADERKQNLLATLEKTSKPRSFSVTNVAKPKTEEEPENPESSKRVAKKVEDLAKLYKLEEPGPTISGTLDDERWEQMVSDFEIMMDPFQDISSKEKYSYRDDAKDDDYYDKRFSKEYSLLHALLTQVDTDSKAVTTKIKEMIATKKPGIGKYNIVDLWNTKNSMHTTKLQTIKEIANVKKLASELKLKEMKNNPPEAENVENAASRFYDTILKGGRPNFISAVGGGMINAPTSGTDGLDVSMLTEDENYQTPTRGLSSSMNLRRDGYEETIDGDYTTTYIDLENDEVQVYVQRFEDGEMEFCALDANGRNVPNYELPDPSLLASLTMRPDSNYTFDEYGRKYKIIDFGTSFDEVDVTINDDDDDY